MMKRLLIFFCVTLSLFVLAGNASASLVDITFTADNTVLNMWTNDGTSNTAIDVTSLSNSGAWNIADTVTLDLTNGVNYDLIWQLGNASSNADWNASGFLAEIYPTSNLNFTPGSLLTSSLWEVSTDSGATWGTATEYGSNGSNGTWMTVAGIDDSAEWIWGATNHNSAETILVRASVTSAVPLPVPVWLLASGLLGLIGIRRKNLI